MARLFAGTPFDIPPTCDRCEKLEEECDCPPMVEEKTWKAPETQTAKIKIEKRKKGKIVTLVTGLLAIDNDWPKSVQS